MQTFEASKKKITPIPPGCRLPSGVTNERQLYQESNPLGVTDSGGSIDVTR